MEEDRIGYLYLNLWKSRLKSVWTNLFPRGMWRSPILFGGLIAILLIGPGIAWHLHRQGQFGRAKRKLKSELGDADYASGPGGLAAMKLQRAAKGDEPQFTSVTLLPGVGMTVMQLTAQLPGRGETQLLAASNADTSPVGTSENRGAIELPWGGMLIGAPTPVATALGWSWQGHTLDLLANLPTHPYVSNGGLLSGQSVDESHQEATGDGATAEGVFRASTFDDHWISKTDTTVSAKLSAGALELTVTAKNVGDAAEPVGIGWHPQFAVANGSRQKLLLKLPDGQQLTIAESSSNAPKVSVEASSDALKAMQEKATEIGLQTLDAAVVDVKTGADGAVELRDPTAGFGLRMTALSNNVREVRASSPGDADWVSVGMQTNTDDPTGQEWGAEGGIAVLGPGQTVEWKVRLEIFSLR